MKATIDTSSLVELTRMLDAMEHRIQDFSVPLTDAARLMETDVREAFPSGGASVGQDWAAHTEATIERWGEHEFGQGPTGNLLSGFRIFVRPFVAGVENTMPHAHLFEHDRHSLARIESAGGTIKRRHSPELPGNLAQVGREFMVITEATQDKATDFILDYAVQDVAA